MKIAIDATYNPSGGSLIQLRNIFKYISTLNDDIDFILYIKKQHINIVAGDYAKNIKINIARIAGFSTVARVIWEQAILPFLLLKEKVDVLFCPGNIAPVFSSVKTVQWIGTIGPFWKQFYHQYSLKEKIPQYFNRILISLSAKKSDMVINQSEFSRSIFTNKYAVPFKKTEVIQIGKDEFFHPIPMTEIERNCVKYNLSGPFILCVSHLYPYKNIIRMIKAFDIAREKTGSDIKLLIAGKIVSTKYYSKILSLVDGLDLKKSIFFLGSVEREKLLYLYSGCLFFIFPSLCESISYTLIEAMCCGAAITCSNTTAIPETCKDAALYFDPNNTEEITECIMQLLNNPNLRNKLSEKSLQRVKNLPTYKEVNVKTLKIMRDLMAKDSD